MEGSSNETTRAEQEAFLKERRKIADESGIPPHRLYRENGEWYINDPNGKQSVKEWMESIDEKSRRMLEEREGLK